MAREPVNRISVQDWRHLLTVGALVGGVLATLLLGGRLKADPAEAEARSLATLVPAPAETPEAPGPAGPTVSPFEDDAARDTDPPPVVTPAPATQPPATPRSEPARPTPAERTPVATRAPRPTLNAPAEGDWTLQFMVTCESAKADRLERDFGNDSRFRMLPVRIEDRDCVRVCWGDFTTRDTAVAHDGVPAGLLAVNGDPIPRRISDLR